MGETGKIVRCSGVRYITYQLVKPCVSTGRPIPGSARTCSERSSFDGPVDIQQ